MQRIIVAEENASPIEPSKVHQGTGNKMFVSKSDNLIDADTLQAAAEIALGRVI